MWCLTIYIFADHLLPPSQPPSLPTPTQGHLEFFICDDKDLDDPQGTPTQECFNKHPLTRADDDGVNSPIDPNYPGRYYTDPPCREKETDQNYDWRAGGGYLMSMNYKLPADLVCDHCVLQMWYCEYARLAGTDGCLVPRSSRLKHPFLA